jgi:hypothetical protein
MKALTIGSYKRGFLTLSSETLEARTWASAYKGNIKPLWGLKWNSSVTKKKKVLDKPLQLKIRRT